MKDSKVFYQQLRYADFYAQLSELNDQEKLVYMELLLRDGMQWSLPDDPQRIAEILRRPVEAVTGVLNKKGFMFIRDGDQLRHKEVIEAQQRWEKRSATNRKNIQSRWQAENQKYDSNTNRIQVEYDSTNANSGSQRPKKPNLAGGNSISPEIRAEVMKP